MVEFSLFKCYLRGIIYTWSRIISRSGECYSFSHSKEAFSVQILRESSVVLSANRSHDRSVQPSSGVLVDLVKYGTLKLHDSCSFVHQVFRIS